MTTPATTHTTAHQLHQAGVNTIPTRPDTTKAPAIKWKPYTTTRTTPEQLTTWFADDAHGYGLAVITGHISGDLEMTELEGPAAHHLPALAALAHDTGLTDLWAKITSGWVERSPSGGWHFIYRLTGMDVPGNTKIAHDKDHRVLAETRGEGGYFIAAPTDGDHHTTGQPWTRMAGGPTTIPTLTPAEREAFHALLATIGAPEPPAAPAQAPRQVFPTQGQDWTEGKRPGEHFETETDWADILTPHGWTYHHTDHDGTRPSKNPAEGWSASTGHAEDRDRLWVYSTSTEFASEQPYTKFGAWALLNHGGDHTAAARALAGEGWGKEPHIALTLEQIMPATTTRKDTTEWNPAPASPSTSKTSSEKPPTTPSTTATADTPTSPSTTTDTDTTPSPQSGPQDSPSPTPAESTLLFSDDGNAHQLIHQHGTHLRYCHERGWMHWDDTTWCFQPAGGGITRELAKQVARRFPEDDTDWKKWKKYTLSAAGTSNMLKQAETNPGISVQYDALDRYAWELNTPGGIVDLRTGTIGPADPTHLHTKTTTVAPDPTADRQLWDTFLTTTFPDPAVREYMQRLIGYAAVGEVTENILPFAYGPGGNGKSVFFETIAAVLGDYATSAPAGFLMEQRYKSEGGTEVARLAGARLVISQEFNERDRFDEAKVKALTGGDSITARFLYQNEFTFKPSHTLVIVGNHEPGVESGGEGFWRRLRKIPFLHKVPEDQKVGNLQQVLIQECAPAVLAWIVEGAAWYAKDGLMEPESVRAATAEYKEAQDTVARFLEDRCTLYPGNPNYMTSVKRLRQAYEAWCHEEGETAVRGRALASQLKHHGVLVGRDVPRSTTGSERMYGGIRLVEDEEAASAQQGRHDLF